MSAGRRQPSPGETGTSFRHDRRRLSADGANPPPHPPPTESNLNELDQTLDLKFLLKKIIEKISNFSFFLQWNVFDSTGFFIATRRFSFFSCLYNNHRRLSAKNIVYGRLFIDVVFLGTGKKREYLFGLLLFTSYE